MSAWWKCICGDHHQGEPRRAGAVTGAGLVMHGPRRPDADPATTEPAGAGE